MGSKGSRDRAASEHAKGPNKVECIYFDEEGNLRVNSAEPREKEAELRKVLDVDDHEEATPDDEEQKTWYIIDVVWMECWLAFVHHGKNCPAPGPIFNDKLLMLHKPPGGGGGDAGFRDEDDDTARNPLTWVGRPNLKPSGKSFRDRGDYRRVSKGAWDAFVELYPTSGPAIWVEEAPLEDPFNWKIDQQFLRRKQRDLHHAREKRKSVDAAEKPPPERQESAFATLIARESEHYTALDAADPNKHRHGGAVVNPHDIEPAIFGTAPDESETAPVRT